VVCTAEEINIEGSIKPMEGKRFILTVVPVQDLIQTKNESQMTTPSGTDLS
jgi:hypothetical protein